MIHPKPTFVYHGTVEKVVDGDTLDLDLDLGMRIHTHTRIRLAHIDTPEHGTEKGDAATAYVRDILPVGAPVVVATEKPDKYGRALATVDFVLPGQAGGDMQDLAVHLMNKGYGKPYEGGKKVPDEA